MSGLKRRKFMQLNAVPLPEIPRVGLLVLSGAPRSGEKVDLAQVFKTLISPIGGLCKPSGQELVGFLATLDDAKVVGYWRDSENKWHLSISVREGLERRELVGNLQVFGQVLYADFPGMRAVFLRKL